MDDSVVEILDDSDVVAVADDKENASVNNASVAVVAPDRRKATRGGVKLDDTVELLSSDDDEGAATGDQKHKEPEADHTAAFTTANNTAVGTPFRPSEEDFSRIKSLVTSTPALAAEASATVTALPPAAPSQEANYTYENNQTARMDEIQDEMCDSYEERPAAEMTTSLAAAPTTPLEDTPATINGNGHQSSSDDYDEEPDDVSTASQSPILGKSMDQQDDNEDAVVSEQEEEEEKAEEGSVKGEKVDEEVEEEGADKMAMPLKKSRVLDLDQLPETCTLLSLPNGGRVYLVGTAHFSKESNEDVAAVIQAVKPDIVVLELCKARTSVLHLDEEKSLELAKELTLEKVTEMVRSQGAMQGLMTCIMLSMSARLTQELGMAPGGEFRRAYREAKAVPGCLVHLGDRPIQVTLSRAFRSLSVWQLVKLAFTMLTSNVSVTADDVEKYKQKDILEAMMEEMAGEYPSFTQVLVEERDTFLAHSMRVAVEGPWRVAPQNDDGGAAEAPVVVGVVGIGHVQGIVKKWDTVTQDDVAEVVKIPEASRSLRLTRLALKSSFVLLSIYGGYRILRNPLQRLSRIIVK